MSEVLHFLDTDNLIDNFSEHKNFSGALFIWLFIYLLLWTQFHFMKILKRIFFLFYVALWNILRLS